MKRIQLFILSCFLSLIFMGIPVYAESPSVELEELHVYLGPYSFMKAMTKECSVKKISDTEYYADGSGVANSSNYIRLAGSRVSSTAKVRFIEAADENNIMEKNYDVSYDDSELIQKYSLGENPFVSTGQSNMFTTPRVSSGTSIFKITVTDDNERLSKDYYLYVATGLSKNSLPENMTLINGQNKADLQSMSLDDSKCGEFGVNPDSEKIVISDDINSIRIRFQGKLLNDSVRDDIPGIYYPGNGRYAKNDLQLSVNFGVWKKVNCNGLSPEIKLEKGLNVIRLIGGASYIAPNTNSRFDSCVLFLYRQGDNSYEKPVGTDTGLKTLRIYQAASSQSEANKIAEAKKEKEENYDTASPDELLSADDFSDLSQLTFRLYSSSPCIYLYVEPEDPEAVVSIAGSEESKGGFYVKLDHENQVSVPIKVTPANGDEDSAEFHYIPIEWNITDSSLASLTVKGGTLSEEYDKNIKDYYLVPDDFQNSLQIEYEEGVESEVAVYENRQDEQHIVDVKNHTFMVDPADIHQVIFKVTAKDGTSNSYTIAIKRQPVSDKDYEASREKAQRILDKMMGGWKKAEGINMNADYWDVFAMASAKESLDGYSIYDVTKHVYKQGTDYSAIILELIMAGENPFDFAGHNYVQELLDYKKENGNYGPFACSIWSLYALDAVGIYDEDLVKTVTGQAGSKTFDLDMKSWALAAIQNHLEDKIEGVNVEAISAIATEYMKGRQDGSGFREGAFEHLSYKNSNLYTHACVIMGLAAAGINLEDEEWKVNGISPLDVFEKCLTEDGMLDDAAYGKSYNRQPMIALGDVINRTNVWIDQMLTVRKVRNLLTVADECVGDTEIGQEIQKKKLSLQTKLNELKETEDDNVAYGLGEEYYSLYDLIGKVKEGWKPVTFMGTDKEKEIVYQLIEEIDAIGTDYLAEVNKITELKSTYDRLSEDSTQCAKLQHYVTNADKLLEASAVADAFNQKISDLITGIDQLSDTPVLTEEEQADALQAVFDTLTESQQALVENAEKLQRLYAGIKKLRAVVDQIEALPGKDQIKLEDAAVMEQVKATEDIYDALQPEEKEQITNSSTLSEILAHIDNLKAASPVIENIAEIGQITEQNWKEKEGTVLIARSNYDKLSEAQKALVTNYQLLEEAEIAISTIKGDKEISQIISMIQELRFTQNASSERVSGPLTLTEENNGTATSEIWTDFWKDYVTNLRSMADQLEESKKTAVTNMADLEAAEGYIRNLQVTNVADMLAALPDASTVTGDGGTPLTPQQVAEIAAAKAAYDELTEEQQELLKSDPVNAALVNNLELVAETASADEGYLTAYLQGYVQKLARLYAQYKDSSVPRTELTVVQNVLDQYNAYPENYKAILEGMSGKIEDTETAVVDMLAHLQGLADQTRKDVSDAAEIDRRIAELPTEITDQNAADTEKAIAEIGKLLGDMTAEAKSYLKNEDRLNAVKELLAYYQGEKTAQMEKFTKGTVDGITAKAASYNSVKITWKAYENADSYEVYRKTADGSWKKLAAVSTLNYTDKTAQLNTVYYYTVRAGSSKWGELVYSSYPAGGVKASTSLGTVTVKKAQSSSAGRNAVITWSKVTGADGYVIYRASSASGKYKNVKVIKKGSQLNYTDQKLTAGQTYYYKVRAYRLVNGKKVYGAYSNAKSVQVKPEKVKALKASRTGKNVKLQWSAAKGITRYQVYRASSKNGTYKAIGTAKKASYKDSRLKKSGTYYYKVRAYKKVKGKKVFGDYSKARKVLVK